MTMDNITANENKFIKYISPDCPSELREYIRGLGYQVEEIKPVEAINSPVTTHPDIQMCRLGCSDASPVIRANTEELSCMNETYPSDVSFNAACTGSYFIHNLNYTNPRLLEAAREAGMELIQVKQGYAKCSVVVVDECAIITYDAGIAAACSDLDVLLVEPGHVQLEGYNTGFIGGTSGRVGGTVVFNGDLLEHPQGQDIREFIESRGLNCHWFSWPLTDIGSVI